MAQPRKERSGQQNTTGGQACTSVEPASGPAPALASDDARDSFWSLHPLDRARVRLDYVEIMLGGYSAAWGPFLAGLTAYWTKWHPIDQPESRPLLDEEQDKIVELGTKLRTHMQATVDELDGISAYIADALPEPKHFVTDLREILDEANAAVGLGLLKLDYWPPEHSTSYVVDQQCSEWKRHQDAVSHGLLPRIAKFSQKLRAVETPSAVIQTSAPAPDAPTGAPEPTNSGMGWQEAMEKTEAHVKAHHGVIPSVMRLSKIISCSRPTIEKAIKRSSYLKARKAEGDRRGAVREVPLTNAVLEQTPQQTEVGDQLGDLIKEQEADDVRDERQHLAAKRARKRA